MTLTKLRPALRAALRRLVCGLRGHNAVLRTEERRLLMRCTSCGHDSPGWRVAGRART